MQRRARSFEATRAILHGVRQVSFQANLVSLRAAAACAQSGSEEHSNVACAATALAQSTHDLAVTMEAEVAAARSLPCHRLPHLEHIRQLVERMQCLSAPVDGGMPGLRNIEEASCLAEAATRHIVNGQD
ncbi:MAG: hypothetical protein MUC50_06610 [Myxococcota bacterium]|nr:hypothetical protein [Myxococcota bacterium]